jgi:hypothetical protein
VNVKTSSKPRACRPGAFLPLCTLLAALLPAALFAQPVNHRPTISWIGGLRAVPGAAVPAQVFTVDDAETPGALTVSAASTNLTLLPLANIALNGSGASRTVALTPVAAQTGVATVTLTVTDEGGKTGATSFTFTVAGPVAGNTPPVIQGVADETIVAGVGAKYGPMSLVVQDAQSSESALVLTKSSSNPALVPVSGIVFGGQNFGRTLTVTPVAGATGRATITLGVSDGVNTTSTSFVLDVVAGNTPPAITGLPAFVSPLLDGAPQPVAFTVTDAQTAAMDLRVTAKSSNEALVPVAGIVLAGSGASRTVTITPTPGAVGAATITLSLSDGDITRRTKLLHVVRDPAGRFAGAHGVFALDSNVGGSTYTTTFGKVVNLRDANIFNLPLVSGFALRVGWDEVESSATPGHYDFHIVENAVHKMAQVAPGQRLSLIITPNEPAYLIGLPGVTTWVDEGITRAVPWDTTLRQRRHALLAALAAYVVDGVPFAQHPLLHVVDPYLPGGHTGIRNPNGLPLRDIPGYSRQILLNTVQDELRALQDYFPGKFVQIGFWPVTDGEDATYGMNAWQWLRQQLAAEFNGVVRPRIGFFVESLAAWRVGPDIDPFTGTPPVSATLAVLNAAQNDAWTGFQMLGNWTRPFNDNHVGNTLNGTPADALEYAYNTCSGRYFEVYGTDLTNAAFQPMLQSWHDFLTAIAVPDVPANLTATPVAAAQVDLSWNSVPVAAAYELQRQTDGGAFAEVYAGPLASFTDTDVTQGHTYGYRVRSATSYASSDWSAPVSVVIPDTTAPVIVSLTASPDVLWPVNHKLVAVTVAASVTDAVDPAPVTRIVAVSSSEAADGNGDGSTSADWEITGPLTLNLRAERAGNGPGRIYTITVEGSDAAGNSATGTVTVTVPHNK